MTTCEHGFAVGIPVYNEEEILVANVERLAEIQIKRRRRSINSYCGIFTSMYLHQFLYGVYPYIALSVFFLRFRLVFEKVVGQHRAHRGIAQRAASWEQGVGSRDHE